MTTEYFITGLFTHVDDQFNEQGINGKHPHAKLYVSEVITLGLLFALKGGGNRAFYRWLSRDYGALFPQLPTRVRLFRRLNTYRDLIDTFKTQLSVRGHRYLWHRTDSSPTRRTLRETDRSQRPVEPTLERRGETLYFVE